MKTPVQALADELRLVAAELIIYAHRLAKDEPEAEWDGSTYGLAAMGAVYELLEQDGIIPRTPDDSKSREHIYGDL
jgi:hypothetical protein